MDTDQFSRFQRETDKNPAKISTELNYCITSKRQDYHLVSIYCTNDVMGTLFNSKSIVWYTISFRRNYT